MGEFTTIHYVTAAINIIILVFFCFGVYFVVNKVFGKKDPVRKYRGEHLVVEEQDPWDVLGEYGRYISDNPIGPFALRDSSDLPCDKNQIFMAFKVVIESQIMNVNRNIGNPNAISDEFIDSFKNCARLIPYFQDGIEGEPDIAFDEDCKQRYADQIQNMRREKTQIEKLLEGV